MFGYRMSHVGHSDFTHENTSSFIKNNCRTWFNINGHPGAMLQFQLTPHSIELPLHNAPLLLHFAYLFFHDSRLSVYGLHTVGGSLNSAFGLPSLPSDEKKCQKSSNNEPPF